MKFIGGGLCASLGLELPQSNILLKLKRIGIEHNYIVRLRFKHIYIVRLEELMTNTDGVQTSLESVQIIDNVLVLQDENSWSPFGLDLSVGALSLANTEVHFKETEFFNNNIPAVYSYNSDLHFHGDNVLKNNSGRECGGALVLRIDSQMYWHQGTQVYILENTAQKYGGGICVDGGLIPDLTDLCFYQIVDSGILNNNDTFVYMKGNVAPITGYEIYAGTVKDCASLITSGFGLESIFSTSHAIFSQSCISFEISEHHTQLLVSSTFSP